MTSEHKIETKLEQLGRTLDTDDTFVAKVMGCIEQTAQIPARPKHNIWRIIMNSRITKFAAAAAVTLISILSLTFLTQTAAPVYALEQTIQASHSIRYLHTKNFFSSHEKPIEAWIEYDVAGTGKNFRIQMPAWTDPWGHDGEKIMVWKDHKAHMWLKKKNMYAVIQDNEIADMVFNSIEQFDPKTTLVSLQQLESEEKVTLNIDVPENKADPIVVSASHFKTAVEEIPQSDSKRGMTQLFNMWKGSENEISKLVLYIDQATKLITSIEFYEQRQDQDHLVCMFEYYDYNQPIAAEMFSLEDEIPDDVMRIDQTARDIGLAQGDLSDNEIAVELIRQFLQALIEQDYAKAGKLWGGVPAERMEKTYGRIKFIRIITIGEPQPRPEMNALFVPCTIEIEENGTVTQWQPKHAYVRKVHGQPQRWEIIGGFRGI